MRTLLATPTMMQMAAEDTPSIEKRWGQSYSTYKNRLYMRCLVAAGILKVAFYLTEHMRSGGRNPVYELFVSRKEQTFLTYDCRQNTWRTARLSLLDGIASCYCSGEKWISKADTKAIQTYLGLNGDAYGSLLFYQHQIRDEQLKKRHRKETDPWDADLKQTPKPPKDWKRWVAKVGIPDNYIYYHYNKKGADTGYCTYCEKEVPIQHPKHNAAGRCPRCRRSITFKSVEKAGTVITELHPMYLLQRCKDGFMCREFEGCRKYPKGEYKAPKCSFWETRRTIYDGSSLKPRAYCMGLYRQCETRWIAASPCSAGWSGNTSGKVYGKTLPDLGRNELRQTGLIERLSYCKQLDPEKYLAVLEQIPQLEQIVKAGLFRMADECIDSFYNFKDAIHPDAGSSLTKALHINTHELKRLRQNNGGTAFLRWLQYEKVTNKELPDETIAWFCKEKIKAGDLQFISAKMSMVQICNYMRRQMQDSRMHSKEMLTT